MARGKKKESVLTPEEKLAQALVPVEEQPYKVPENWCWCKLDATVEITTGRKDANYGCEDGTYPFFTCASEPIKCNDYSFDGESLLLPGNGANVGQVFYYDGKFEAYQRTYVLQSKSQKTDLKYIYYNIRGFWEDYNKDKQYGSATNYIKLGNFLNYSIPVAPYSEQKRIVGRIEYLFAKLDEAKEKAQSVLDSFETRKAAILHKAFTGELTAKWRAEHGLGIDTWNKKPLVEVTHNHDSRRIPLSQAERSNLERRYDYYGASGVIDKVDRFLFEGRNLLIGEDGANLVTRSKPIAFIADGQYWVNNHAHVLSTKAEMVLDFLCYYINSIDLTPYVTGSAQPKMTQAKMNGIPVPVPSVPEQTEIVRILDSLLAKEQQAKEAAEAVLEKIDLLKKSILARAFRGELGTNDPTEESALELLKNNI